MLAGGFAAAGGLLAEACAPKGSALAAHRNVLNLLLPWEPTALTLLNTTDSCVQSISPKMAEGLLVFDAEMRPQPALATAWTASPDSREFSFDLRRGVKWHDGRDFTAEDVLATISILKNFHPQGRVFLAGLDSATAPDPHRVVLQLSKPVPFLLTTLMASQSPMVPAHLYPAGKDPGGNPANIAPIGTGPFLFKEWSRGAFIRLIRNPDYWDKGDPALDGITMKVIPDLGARSAAFETGQLDFGSDTPLPLPEIKRFATLPGFVADQRGYSYSPAVISMTFNLERPLLQDIRVRRAIAHAVDRKVVADICWQGYATPAPSPISTENKTFFAADIPTYPIDLARARALMAQAGYGKGKRPTLDLIFSTAQTPDVATGYYIKQALDHIGIEVNLVSMDQPTFVRTVFTKRDFDLFLAGYNNGPDPTIGVQKMYHTAGFKRGLPYSNGSHYSNAEADALLEAAAIETDQAKRIEQFRAFQHIIARDLPALTLVTKQPVTIVADRVRQGPLSADGPKGTFAGVAVAHA